MCRIFSVKKLQPPLSSFSSPVFQGGARRARVAESAIRDIGFKNPVVPLGYGDHFPDSGSIDSQFQTHNQRSKEGLPAAKLVSFDSTTQTIFNKVDQQE